MGIYIQGNPLHLTNRSVNHIIMSSPEGGFVGLQHQPHTASRCQPSTRPSTPRPQLYKQALQVIQPGANRIDTWEGPPPCQGARVSRCLPHGGEKHGKTRPGRTWFLPSKTGETGKRLTMYEKFCTFFPNYLAQCIFLPLIILIIDAILMHSAWA